MDMPAPYGARRRAGSARPTARGAFARFGLTLLAGLVLLGALGVAAAAGDPDLRRAPAPPSATLG